MAKTIHPLATVDSNKVGEGTVIEEYAVIRTGTTIGSDCLISNHVSVADHVIVGDRVRVWAGARICDGVTLMDDVVVGSNAVFAQREPAAGELAPGDRHITLAERGSSIGAGAVIYAGVTISQSAVVQPGAIVSRSVPPGAIVSGNPARIIGYTGAKNQGDREYGVPELHGAGNPGAFPSIVAGVSLHRLPLIPDLRGNLSVGEFTKTVPFEPRRYFLVFDVPSEETRGEHAHHVCKQFLICVRGRCSVVADDGRNRQEFLLDSPALGLYLPQMTWGIQYRYSADAVLLVFASEHYNSSDYIRNYAEFLETTGVKQ